MPVRVVLADGYGYLRSALLDVLAAGGIDVISQTRTASAVRGEAERHRPDAVLIDLCEPDTRDAVAAAAEIRRRLPATGVLVLAEHLEPAEVRELLGGGARRVGYLLKGALTQDDLLAAVRWVAAGGAALDPEIIPALLDRADPLESLTPRELEVLALIAEGCSNAAIAARLVVTKRAVEKHIGAIFRKLPIAASSAHDRRVLAARLFLARTPPARFQPR